jgi:hypothetical protein
MLACCGFFRELAKMPATAQCQESQWIWSRTGLVFYRFFANWDKGVYGFALLASLLLGSRHLPWDGEVCMASRQGACFSQFVYRTNPDNTIDSICAFCFLTVATAENRADLHQPESDHQCMKAIGQLHEVTKSPGGPTLFTLVHLALRSRVRECRGKLRKSLEKYAWSAHGVTPLRRPLARW